MISSVILVQEAELTSYEKKSQGPITHHQPNYGDSLHRVARVFHQR